MNSDSNVQHMIDAVILEWTQQGRAFTTYEVTREVQERRRATGMTFVRHADVRDYYEVSPALDDVISGQDYTRTLLTIPDPQHGSVQPWLYHLTTYDPLLYRPIDRNTLVGHTGPHPNSPQTSYVGSITLVSKSPVAALPTPSAPPPTADEHIMANASGEVWLPSDKLLGADLIPGDTFYLYSDGKRVILSKKQPDANLVITRQVERRGNARLSPVVRQQLNLHGDKFCISDDVLDGDPVLVITDV